MTNPLLSYLNELDNPEPVIEKLKYVLPIDNLCNEIGTGVTTLGSTIVGSTITAAGSGYWDSIAAAMPAAKTHCLK